MFETTLMAMNWGWQVFFVASAFFTFMTLSLLSYVGMPGVNRWIVESMVVRANRVEARKSLRLAEQLDD